MSTTILNALVSTGAGDGVGSEMLAAGDGVGSEMVAFVDSEMVETVGGDAGSGMLAVVGSDTVMVVGSKMLRTEMLAGVGPEMGHVKRLLLINVLTCWNVYRKCV